MVDGLWEHPDWTQQRSGNGGYDDEGPGLEYIDLDAVNNWVVKLTFNRVNEANGFSGNGFFLNIPDIQDKHIILTAAHNLIKNGQRSLKLKAIYNNPFEIDPTNPSKVTFADDQKPAIIEVDVENTEENVYICKEYILGSADPSADYGVIRIPRTSPKGPRGFSFSLKLAFRKSFKGNVHVSGFRGIRGDPSDPSEIKKTLRPVTSSAIGMSYHGGHVEYRATTEPGISGSPVWVQYQKYIAVVAIHNQGLDDKFPKQGSRGALLTVDLLREVFKWVNQKLVRTGVQIQVRPAVSNLKKKKRPTAGLPDRGLFLSFSTNSGFGRVRLGSGTKFDWMPAQVDGDSLVHYALLTAGEKKWLRFNADAMKYQGVELVDKLDKPGCLLQNFEDKDCAWMRLGIDTGKKDQKTNTPVNIQLKMQGTHIKLYDESRETSEVSLIVCGTPGSDDQFNRFILKDA